MSNFEKIRSMDIDEMSKFLSEALGEVGIDEFAGYDFCKNHCPRRFEKTDCACDMSDEQIMKWWLEQEATK